VTAVLDVSVAFDAVPPVQAIWILESSEVAATTWRCLGVREIAGKKNQFEITAVAHNPTKYDFIEQGLVLESKPVSTIKLVAPIPTDLAFTETVYYSGLATKSRVTISWTPPGPLLTYRVTWRYGLGVWHQIPDTSAQTVEISELEPGELDVVVRSVNSIGNVSPPLTGSYSVVGQTIPPAAFDYVNVSEIDTGARVYLFGYSAIPAPPDWRGAEIRYQPGTTSTPDWNAMTLLSGEGTYFTVSGFESAQPTAIGPFTFAFRSRDSVGLSAMTVFNVTLGLNALDIGGPKVALRSSALAFINQKNGAGLIPASITLTASTINMPSATYVWHVDGVVQAGATASTFVLAAFTGAGKLVRVDVTSGANTAFDLFTIYSVNEGDDSLTWGLSNEDQSVLVDAAGTPVAGALPLATTMLVARGATILTSGVAYSVAATSNCTATINAATGVASVTAIAADVASATFRATIGTTLLDKVLTLHKSYPGAAGAAGGAGAAGTRGSRTLYSINVAYTASYNDGSGAGAASYKHQATVLIAAATAGTTPTTPIKGDTVVFSNGNDYITTYTNDGTYATNVNNSWALPGTVLDGAVLVNGSVTAPKINVTNLAALNANLGTVTAGAITGTADIAITGTGKFDGQTTNTFGAAAAVVANSSKNTMNGLIVYKGTLGGAYSDCFALTAIGDTGVNAYLSSASGAAVKGSALVTGLLASLAVGVLGETAAGTGGKFTASTSGGVALSATATAAGTTAFAAAGKMTLDNSTFTWNGYTYAAPAGSSTLALHADGIWRDPVTGARVLAALGFTPQDANGTFKTYTGSASAASAVATTVYTLPNTAPATYLVSVNVGAVGDAANYSAFAVVSTDGATARLTTVMNAPLQTITLVGLAVKSTQSSGATRTINVTITKVA
jgi:hypothetical protein